MFSYLRKIDWLIVVIVLVLLGIGMASIYSSSNQGSGFLNFYKQAIFIGIGFLLMFIFAIIDYRNLRDNSYLILIFYFVLLVLLAGLFIFGSPIRGVKSWYRIGHWAFAPTEFIKLVLIVLLAKYFSQRHV